MNLTTYAWGYGAALLTLGVLDGLWLGVIAREFYRSQMVAYGVYDLTNMATLKAWPAKLALVDVSWGTFITAMAGLAAYSAMTWAAAPAASR